LCFDLWQHLDQPSAVEKETFGKHPL